jgi:hypothetical protein
MSSVQEIEILSGEECDRVHRDVHDLRRRWIRRHTTFPFFTLGAAVYLDATGGRLSSYVDLAAAENPVLEEHFGWLQERVLENVRDFVQAPCVTDPRLALPGFHVFIGHPEFVRPMASKHFDLQYEAIDWSGIGEPEPSRQLSITVPIRVPSNGATLRVWDVSWEQARDADKEARRRLAQANRRATSHPYRAGVMAIHSGHLLHQIGPFVDPQPDDERLTLQAHALPVNEGERWIVYW